MKLILIPSVILAFLTANVFSQEEKQRAIPTIAVSITLQKILEATKNNDFEKFMSLCNDDMKQAIDKETLTKASKQVSTPMKDGYKKIYWGVIDRASFKTHYWKIDFDKKGEPDMLVELSIKDNKVAGFYLR